MLIELKKVKALNVPMMFQCLGPLYVTTGKENFYIIFFSNINWVVNNPMMHLVFLDYIHTSNFLLFV